MTEKKFKLTKGQIRRLIEPMGAGVASDQITVEGLKVGYMYREEPDFEHDSGWRFMSGLEDEEYREDASNFAIYNVNTIANYDSSIIPYLDMPIGTQLGRIGDTDNFELL
jgi:hypothetical protein